MELNQQYWNERYLNGYTGWDIGHVSTPIKEYIDQLNDTSLRVLIPGAGNAYEAEYLHDSGFENTTVVDISEIAIRNVRKRIPQFPRKNLVVNDFFNHQGSYDLIIEQTFFCAIDPTLRSQYVDHAAELLNPKGCLVGVLWDIELNHDKPPFGGSTNEYKNLFEDRFEIRTLEKCHNSVSPRMGTEVFINFRKA